MRPISPPARQASANRSCATPSTCPHPAEDTCKPLRDLVLDTGFFAD
jgi:hypothetical protein